MLQMFRCALVSIAVLLPLGPQGFSQQLASNSASYVDAAAAKVAVDVSQPIPGAQVIRPALVGTYYADGNYSLPSAHAALPRSLQRSGDVPPWMRAKSREGIIDDYEPPAHARRALKPRSAWSNFRDGFIAAAYGREKILSAPSHLITDSKNRLIVVDTDEAAIHVLDGKNSFRIAGGVDRRLKRPTGVAVDQNDNIYVSDAKRGVVVVYNSQGIFQRYIGKFQDEESMIQEPTAIAIDRSGSGRLFVLDAPVNELLVYELDGHLLKRIGGRRNACTKLEAPSEIAVNRDHIVIMDAYSSRVQVLDRDFKVVSQFKFRNVVGVPVRREMGLALNSEGNIYIVAPKTSELKEYTPTGEHIATLSLSNVHGDSSIITPTALWIDSSNRIFVSDSHNSRVQVYETQ